MKLGLVNPNGSAFFTDREFMDFWSDPDKGDYYKKAWSGISTGLLIVASLTPDIFEIKIIDENFETIDFDEDFDIIGITGMTQQASRGYEIADRFRQRGVYTVMGGIHATTVPYDAKLHADTVIVGEAEEIWPEFIEDFLAGKQKQFYKSSNSKGIDINKSPIPRYDLLNTHYYKTVWPQTTRGCPHQCEFCVASNIYGSKYRHKTIEHVINELEIVNNLWSNPTISFADDNMFVNRPFAKDLITEFKTLKFSWIAQSDISIGDDNELLDLLYDSGCESVFVGLESVSEKNLHLIDPRNWKQKRLHRYPELIKNIQSHGIGVHASFVIGLDNDDLDTFQQIIDFTLENNLFGVTALILTPYPGCSLRVRLQKEGRLLQKDWRFYNGGNITFLPKHLTPQQLKDGLLKIWESIYTPEVQSIKRQYFKNIYKNLALKKLENKSEII